MFYNLKHIIVLFSLFSNVESFNNIINRRNFLTKTLTANTLYNMNECFINTSDDNNYYNNNKNNSKNNKEPNYKNNIFFTGGLNEENCFNLNNALLDHKNQILLSDSRINHINLYIQSPGGSLLPTLALSDEIKNLGIPVHTYIRGYAASAATLLSVVGTERYMYKHSVMLIHGVHLENQEVSNLLDIKDLNSNVDLFMKIVKNIYMENSNLTEEKLEEMFIHDKWIDAETALSYGLIDKII